MNTLAEDRDEFLPSEEAERRWVTRARRAAYIEAGQPASWIAELVTGDEPPHMVALGLSAGDVLLDAAAYAEAAIGLRRGLARWLVDNRAGEEDASSTWLVVRAVPDAPWEPLELSAPLDSRAASS